MTTSDGVSQADALGAFLLANEARKADNNPAIPCHFKWVDQCSGYECGHGCAAQVGAQREPARGDLQCPAEPGGPPTSREGDGLLMEVLKLTLLLSVGLALGLLLGRRGLPICGNSPPRERGAVPAALSFRCHFDVPHSSESERASEAPVSQLAPSPLPPSIRPRHIPTPMFRGVRRVARRSHGCTLHAANVQF